MNERPQDEGAMEPQGLPEVEAEPPPPSGPIGWPEGTAASPAAASPAAASPDVTPPPAAPPPAAMPAAAQPAVQWAAPPAPGAYVAGKPPRTTLAAVAGGVLLALGIIGALLGALLLASGSFFGELAGSFGDAIPGLPEGMTVEQFLGGVFGFLGIIVIFYSVLYIIGGIGVLRSSDFGRIMGLIVAILSGLIWAGGLSGGQSEGFGFALVMFLVHLYVFVVLAFRWRQPAPAVATMPPA